MKWMRGKSRVHSEGKGREGKGTPLEHIRRAHTMWRSGTAYAPRNPVASRLPGWAAREPRSSVVNALTSRLGRSSREGSGCVG